MELLESIAEENDSESCNMKVIVRVKPPGKVNGICPSVLQVVDDNLLIFDPPQEQSLLLNGHRQSRYIPAKRTCKYAKFMFDKVFDIACTNEEVFLNTTEPMLKDLINGYNCSVFAYGATGSGKTYTMIGSPTDPGILLLTSMNLFQRLKKVQNEKDCEVSVSYLEVYNETIKDLLKPSTPLKLHENPETGVVVAGLSFHKPKSSEDLFNILEFGNKNRCQHFTQANSQSSRSHAIFQIHLRQQNKICGITSSVSKMSLIDLAGSERATVVSGLNRRLQEGSNINKSLLALGNCINALAGVQKQSHHVPYRDSKLTHILKDSLGGNCRTLMIANISTIPSSYEETYNTLKYADRARLIQIKLTNNVVNVDAHLSNYGTIVQGLQKQVRELKDELVHVKEQNNSANASIQLDFSVKQSTADSQKMLKTTDLYEFLNEYELNIKKLLECESSLRRLELKKIWKQKYMQRISLSSVQTSDMNLNSTKLDRTMQFHKDKERRLYKVQNELMETLKMKGTVLKEKEKKYYNSGLVSQTFINIINEKQNQFEATNLKHQVMHLNHVIYYQESQVNKTENLLQEALKLLNTQHKLLGNHGHLTNELEEDFDSIMNSIVNSNEVSWSNHIQKNGNSTPKNIDFVASLPVLGHITSPFSSSHKSSLTVMSPPSFECISAKPAFSVPNISRSLQSIISPACVNARRLLFIDQSKKCTPKKTGLLHKVPKSACTPAISKSLEQWPARNIGQVSTSNKSPKINLNGTFEKPNPENHRPRFPIIEFNNKLTRNPLVIQEMADSYKMRSSSKLSSCRKNAAPYHKSSIYQKTVGSMHCSRRGEDIQKENCFRFKFKF